MAEQLLRGALIGAGSIAQYHLAAWQQLPRVEIAAISNRTLDRAHELAARFGIGLEHTYPGVVEMLGSETELDFVDIVTAPDDHRSAVEAAAEARVPHILCQKPFAPTIEDARQMIAAAGRAGSTLTINENWRWRPWYRELKTILDDGDLGSLHYLRIAAHRNVTLGQAGEPPPFLERQAYTGAMPRLIVYEWGIHLIDTVRMLLGEPQWVHASMSNTSPYFAGEDRALMTVGLGPVTASIDISWGTHAAPELPTLLEQVTVEGDLGTVDLIPNQGQGDLIRRVEVLPVERLPADRDRPWNPMAVSSKPAHDGDIAAAYQASFTAAHRHFAACWRSGIAPETHALDNLKTLRTTFAAYDSADDNRVVHLEGIDEHE